MATVIRLSRFGKNNQAYYRVVVADSRAKKEGRIVDQLGSYHQVKEPPVLKVNEAKVLQWLLRGATPSETVRGVFKRAGIWQKFLDAKPKKAKAAPASA